MISVEEIEPQEAPQDAAPEEAVQLPAPEPEVVDGGAAHSAEPAAEALDIEDAPPEPPKKRGRPKAAPKEKNSAEAKRSSAESGSPRGARSATLRTPASAYGRATPRIRYTPVTHVRESPHARARGKACAVSKFILAYVK